MKEFSTFLDSLNLGKPAKLGNLFMVPVLGIEKHNTDYYNLSNTLEKGNAEITEVSESGNVPAILFKNRADKPILLVDGEELVGCKQNRVLNLSVLAPESKDTEIPVSCVEQGRWSSRSRNFHASDNFEFADLKAAKMCSVSASMERSSRAESDQSAVWSSIASKSSRSGSNSSTSAMDGIFRRNQNNLSELLKNRKVMDNQIGSIFLTNGQVRGLEIFQSVESYKQYEKKITRGYLLSCMDNDDEPHIDMNPREVFDIQIRLRELTNHLRNELYRSRDRNEHSMKENFSRTEETLYRTDYDQLELSTTIQLVTSLRNMIGTQKSRFHDEMSRFEDFDRDLNNIHTEANELLSRLTSLSQLSSSNSKKTTGAKDVASKAEEFIDYLKKITLKSYKGIGVGENIRGSSSGVFLGGLFWEDKLVHLTSVSAK